MDPIDVRLLRELERGLPFVPAPFDEIGKRLGLSGDEVVERIGLLKRAGIIRKFRARIDQRKVGITANALVAWKPAGAGNDDLGKLLAEFPSVTHCYERRPVPGRWEFTYYTVHHGYSKDRVLDEVKAVAEKIGCSEYTVLFSTREFKRVPNVRLQEHGGDVS
ncbi:MAG: siroheme decarboxylase subunit beta [Methanoregula sp.]|jgi:DNA-binding Lrp family transcriptional regulator|uniref:siroheme decarboxylase subunit beta n=1 Tax=Methanoregula sp. TaxID=2052170 RepID=UPI003D0BC9B4